MRKRQILLYILVLIVLAATVWLLFRFSPSSDIDTVPVVLPTTTVDDSGSQSKDEPEPTEQAVVITADTVQAALQTLSRADNYSRTLSVETFWSGGSSSQTIDVAARGSNIKMSISRPDDTVIKHILIDSGEKWIWYSDSPSVFHGAAAQAEADQYQTLLSYEDILTLDRKDILEASYSQYEGEMCIHVRYISGEFRYENHAWIAVVSGLLISLETYDGEELIYRMSSTIPDLSTPDESVFVKPEA